MSAKLNPRQAAFVDAYRATGNATEAARRAGYKGTEATLRVTGHRLLTNDNVRAEIDRLEAKARKPQIADAEELLEFWTKVIRGEEPAEMRDRLKASELRGKAMAMFVEKREVTGANGGPLLVDAVEAALARAGEGGEHG